MSAPLSDEQIAEAVEAARRVVEGRRMHEGDTLKIARALLSEVKQSRAADARAVALADVLDIVREECARLSDCSPPYVQLVIEDRLRAQIPAPPAGAGWREISDDLALGLYRMLEHFGDWANGHSEDATPETWAALDGTAAVLRRYEDAALIPSPPAADRKGE